MTEGRTNERTDGGTEGRTGVKQHASNFSCGTYKYLWNWCYTVCTSNSYTSITLWKSQEMFQKLQVPTDCAYILTFFCQSHKRDPNERIFHNPKKIIKMSSTSLTQWIRSKYDRQLTNDNNWITGSWFEIACNECDWV